MWHDLIALSRDMGCTSCSWRLAAHTRTASIPVCITHAFAAHSGDIASQWTRFITSKWPLKSLSVGAKRYAGTHNITESTPNFWDNYKEDIRLTHELGCNAFRISIEWARVEPKRGYIDQEAVQR